MDGFVYSATSPELAAPYGPSVSIVLTPLPGGLPEHVAERQRRAAIEEAAPLRAGGGQPFVIFPEGPELAAIGPRLTGTPSATVREAGIARGLAIAPDLAPHWNRD
jgi:hypothetical protein